MASKKDDREYSRESPSKRVKSSHGEIVECEESIHEKITDLSNFKVDKVLFNNSKAKTVCLQGTFDNRTDEVGIVLLEKTAFEEQLLTEGGKFFSEETSVKKLFHNDIYGNYESFPVAHINAIKTTIIHPATEKHIQKYAVHNSYIVNETSDIYKDIVLPHIQEEQFDLKWVFNILEHISESERIVFEDTHETNGFVLLPDLKWDGKTLENLYLLAIVRVSDIKSLRDLTGDHLDLLKNIRDKGTNAIQEKYNLDSSQLRIYLHYQPSFYHLHVHFTYLKYDAPGIYAERSHLLSNVISNLELIPDYYKRVTLPFVVYENSGLFKKFSEKGILKPLQNKS